MASSVQTDKETIVNLGGPAKVADLLGFSIQRVQNWMVRGIPAKVKVDYPEHFLKKAVQKDNAA